MSKPITLNLKFKGTEISLLDWDERVIRNIEGFTDAPIEEEAITDRQLTVGENLNTINVKYINNPNLKKDMRELPAKATMSYKYHQGFHLPIL